MAQSVANVVIQVVYSTKDRRAWLKDRDLCERLYKYMATILRNNVDSPAIVINGYEDHIHILCQLSRKYSIAKLVQESKTETSKWMKKQSPATQNFTWQSGYGAFSVSQSNIPQAKRYIENQVKHHQRVSFQDEFRLLCERHGIELDERYAWD
jgi:REP element-mobilizing transposase RayT